MARPTDSTRILNFISEQPGKRAAVSDIARGLRWQVTTAAAKVTKGVKEGQLFINADGWVTKKRAPKARVPRALVEPEQLELPLAASEDRVEDVT